MTAAAHPDRPQARHPDDEAELHGIIRTRSFRKGHFVLSSGAESELYFNLKPTMMDPRGALLAARAFLARIRKTDAELVGGLEMGAVPLIGAVAALSEAEGRPIRTFFVRKKAKAYGTMALIEGLAPGETLAGRRVLAVDDVATTGRSILAAVDAVRGEGGQVDTALVLIDRDEGAAAMLADRGVRLLAVFRGKEFL